MDPKLNGGPLVVSTPSRRELVGPALEIVHAGGIMGATSIFSLIAAFAFGSAGVLGAGLLVAIGVIGGCLLSPAVWRAAAEAEAARPVELPSEAAVSDRDAKVLLARMAAARAQLDDVLGSTRRRRNVLVRVRRIRDLERAAVVTLRRVEALSCAPGVRAPAEVPKPTEQPSWTPEATVFLERAAAARRDRIDAVNALSARRLRELSRCEYLTSCLEAIPAELAHLQALELDVREGAFPDPICDADVLRDELRHVREGIGDIPS